MNTFFERIKTFNQDILPLFREYFTLEYFTEKDAKDFLEKHKNQRPDTPSVPQYYSKPINIKELPQGEVHDRGIYVSFTKIPKNLTEIITPTHAYWVNEIKGTKMRMGLDNDYDHWIDIAILELVPPEEMKERRDYNNQWKIRAKETIKLPLCEATTRED